MFIYVKYQQNQSKLSSMQRRQIPEGYVSSFDSHTNPAQSQPPPPIILVKEAQTLMGHSLKELIKERLYGNIINYNRLQHKKKSYLSPNISPTQHSNKLIAKSTSSIPDHKDQRVSEFRTNIQKRIDSRYDSVVRKANLTIKQQKEVYRNSLTEIEEALLIRSNRHKQNRSAFSSKNDSDSNEKSIEYEMDKYKGSSFLSAIEEDEGQQGIRSKKKSLKLSPLAKNNNLADKFQKIKNITKSPILSRLEIDKFDVDPQFWEQFYKKQKQKYQNELEQAIISQLNNKDQSNLLDNKSFNLTSVGTSKSNNNLISSLIPAEKSKFLLFKSVFSKELFQEYLSNPKHVIKRLVQHIFSFFEFNGKIYDQMKIQDYKRLLEPMITAGPRVWAVCVFRFFDTDKNGIICTNDIFKIFKELDQLENDLKQESQSIGSKSVKMVIEMKKVLQKLREVILTQSFDEKIILNSRDLQPLFQIKYLEQSVLRRKEVRYSDLQLILGHHMKNTLKESKRSVIQTTKQISIKMSSCYRYSFLATDHNEQTREDRDQIQTLKQSLKRDKMEMKEKEKENDLINKKLAGIEYSTFIDQKLYSVVREIAFASFGIQIM